ncbi:MAG: aldo/keto reductase [Moorea sp. SIO3C2]|nr:aldo/keto reductase [Moorena sp. SIO3C2]
MKYRRFGRTELRMPVFSCGGMRFHCTWDELSPSEIPEKNQINLEAIIRRSLEVGINHFETSRTYGTSEMQLGWALSKLPRDQVLIQTKITPISDSQEFQRQVEKSLSLLQVDYLDLLTLHGINDPQAFKDSLCPGGCLDRARELQKQGKARYIGFATHAPTELIVKTIETDRFDYVNLHWYYINQFNWPAIEAADRHDMGVFIISPSDKGGMLHTPPKRLVELCHPLHPMMFNDLFCLSHHQVKTLSLGAARPSDFDAHVQVLDLLDRSEEILPPIVERLEKAAIARLGEEWWRTWHIGLPPHHKTPKMINIPMILWLRNLAIAYDLVEYAKMRYNLLGYADFWHPGTRAENIKEIDLSDCLRHSPHADKIPALLDDAHQRLAGEPVQKLSRDLGGGKSRTKQVWS